VQNAVSSFNSLLTWTQFVGIAIAVVTFIVAAVGFQDNRADRARLQEKLDQAQTEFGRIDQALDELKRVKRANALAQIGQRQLVLDNLREAVAQFQKAMEELPDDVTLKYLWADAWLRLYGKEGARQAYDELRKVYRKEHDSFPSVAALYAYAARLVGDRLAQRKDTHQAEDFYEEAERVFEDTRRKDPFLLDSFGESAYGAYAGMYRRRGSPERAARIYEDCAQVTPNNSYILNNLALLRYCTDRVRARELFKRCSTLAQKKIDENPNDYFAVFDWLTARIALDEPFADLKPHLDNVFLIVRSRSESMEPLEKFLVGLRDLDCGEHKPPAYDEVVKTVQRQVGKPAG
jgi:tetratricopeptide (TPR) repeat protein